MKKLNRRTILKGVGASVALPYLTAMTPALAEEQATQRFGAVYTPHGVIKGEWTPEASGTDYELKSILSPLEDFKDRMTIYNNMDGNLRNTAGSGHAVASCTWLSGAIAKDTSGADVSAGKTIDQIIADHIGQETPLPSIELAIEDVGALIGACDGTSSCGYINTISWKEDTQPNPMVINPRTVFERMFGIGATQEQRLTRVGTDKSLLDSIMASSSSLSSKLGVRDRARLDDYLSSVREVERRIGNLEGRMSEQGSNLSAAPVEIPELYEDHARLMFDLQLLAFKTDSARVSTFMLSRELNQRTYPQIGVPEQHHGVSHHGYNPEREQLHALINQYHVMLFAEYVQKLKDTEDFGGSLLDNTMLLYGAGMMDGNVHQRADLSNLLIGGTSKGNVFLDGQTPNTNLLLGILESFGIHQDSLGHSNGIIHV